MQVSPGINTITYLLCMQINMHGNETNWYDVLLHKQKSIFTYYICRINKKAQIVENLLKTEFNRLYKVSPDSVTRKIGRFLKGNLGSVSTGVQ